MLDLEQLTTYVREAEDLHEALDITDASALHLEPIGQGEYNANYRFVHPGTGAAYVLRVNLGSQMHLDDQIGYEYRALQLLEVSGRTPRAHFVDGSRTRLPYGVLVMEFLPGRPLVYETDLALAAAVLADTHSVPVPADTHLIAPAYPLHAILDECETMFDVYRSSPYAEGASAATIERLLTRGRTLANVVEPVRDGGTPHYGRATASIPARRHVISTELNSGNFLINSPAGRDYLVDWEKPIAGAVEQDLAHFLAPTTTLWRTDTALTREQMAAFVRHYREAVADRFPTDDVAARLDPYISVTCLRGITWCAMGYVEYQRPDRLLKSGLTYQKMQLYLNLNFLKSIERDFFG